MFDENGIWHEETYNQPQTGALGALNVLNQFTSYGNAQASKGRQRLKDMSDEATYGEKHGQDLTQYPEGEAASDSLGISHDTSTGIFGNIPQQKLKSALVAAQTAKGSDPLDEDEVSQVYLAQGITPPTSYLNSGAKKAAAEERAEAAFMTRAAKSGEVAYKLATDQGRTDQQARQAKVDAVKNEYLTAGKKISPDQEAAWQAHVAAGAGTAGPKVTQGIETSKSRQQKNEAETEKIDAQAEQVRQLTEPTVAAEWSKAGLNDARAALVRVNKNLAEIKEKNGGFTEAGKVAAEKSLVQLEQQIANASDPVKHAMDNPVQKALVKKVAKQAGESADAIRVALGLPPMHTAAKPPAAPAATGKKVVGYRNKSTGETKPADDGPPAQ